MNFRRLLSLALPLLALAAAGCGAILVADVSMSLDNVLAVAGAAKLAAERVRSKLAGIAAGQLNVRRDDVAFGN